MNREEKTVDVQTDKYGQPHFVPFTIVYFARPVQYLPVGTPKIHILRRNCLLQRVIQGKIKGGIKVTGRRGRRRRKLLADLKEKKGYSH